jgi:hypothetical protein
VNVYTKVDDLLLDATALVSAALNSLDDQNWQVRRNALKSMAALIKYGWFICVLHIETDVHSILLDLIRAEFMAMKFIEKAAALLKDEHDDVQNGAISLVEAVAKHGKAFQPSHSPTGYYLHAIKDATILVASATSVVSAALNNFKAEDWKLRQNALNSMTALIQHG